VPGPRRRAGYRHGPTAGSTSARLTRDETCATTWAALGADYALFVVGLTLASQSTLLPAFAATGRAQCRHRRDPGRDDARLVPASLFAAGHEALPRKLPFILRYTVWERVPFAVLPYGFFHPGPAPVVALVYCS